jgi:SAM-dependent methyltransferase
MAASASAAPPNPAVILDALNAYQLTAALKGAIELEFFTHVAAGAGSAAEIAKRCGTPERGVRIVCDFLAVAGFLTKAAGVYGLTPVSAAFLDKRSPAYIGSMASFLAHERHTQHFADVAAAVRKGGSLEEGNMAPDDPIWVEFARAMAPLMGMLADLYAPFLAEPGRPQKTLDIAAGHGLYGIAIGKLNPAAEIVAVDWGNVLAVAAENATRAGLGNRFRTIPGSAFDVDFGGGYDLVLLPNFLHHFDPATNVRLLKKIRSAMKPGGRLATIEFVPNDDRISPSTAAAFSLMMLCSTPAGDAHTFRELDQMFREAGFGRSKLAGPDSLPTQLILTQA